MIDRRKMLLAMLAALTAQSDIVQAAQTRKPFVLDPVFQPQLVTFPSDYLPGTIVVDVRARFLYLVQTHASAIRYGIGVGKAGLAFSGSAIVGRKAKWPQWRPTANMIKRNPAKYLPYAEGVPGGPNNPLGARALYLYRNGNDTLYRIHGTTEPWTIGKAVSNGCVRMVNAHVSDLYERVPVGAQVVVI